MIEKYKGVLVIRKSWLIDNKVFSRSNCRVLLHRGDMQGVKTNELIIYNTIPDRFKHKIMEKLDKKSIAIIAKHQWVTEALQPLPEARRYFSDYKLSDGRYLTSKQRNQYYANAVILNAIIVMREKSIFPFTWNEITDFVQSIDKEEFPYTLSLDKRNLLTAVNRYKKEGFEGVIYKGLLNNNARKLTFEEETLIVELLADPRNIGYVRIAELFNSFQEKRGKKTISEATVRRIHKKHALIIHPGRYGEASFNNNVAMQVKRKAPSAPLYYWTLDGWDVELLFQERTQAGVTAYHFRPVVVVVLDTFNKYPIGYAVGRREKPELIIEALRNAVWHSTELLGGMYRPHQIQSDNVFIKTLKPYYSTLGLHVTPAKVKNAKAKIIEPWFRWFNARYCQLEPNWSGVGVKSRSKNQPNADFIAKYKKQFPDYEGVCRQVSDLIEQVRTDLKDDFVTAFNLESTKKLELSMKNYLLQFGVSNSRKILMRGSGLLPVIEGQKRAYDCFEFDFRKHQSEQWIVKYDPMNLNHVLAVNEDNSLQFLLSAKHIQPMGFVEQNDKDREQLKQVRDYNSLLKEQIVDQRALNNTVINKLLEDNNNLLEQDTLSKLLITDSKGQHKRNKYDSNKYTSIEEINERIENVKAENPEPEPFNIYDLY